MGVKYRCEIKQHGYHDTQFGCAKCYGERMKLLRWLFWNAVYLVRPRPRTLVGILDKTTRTQWPWRQFRPTVWHNDYGKQWEIILEHESSYSREIDLPVWAHFAQPENGGPPRIVGMTIWDERLRGADWEKFRLKAEALLAVKKWIETGEMPGTEDGEAAIYEQVCAALGVPARPYDPGNP